MYRKYLFFDLDGTLTDSMPGITRSVRYALERLGIEVPDLQSLVRFVGPPLKESFMTFYGMTAAEAERAIALTREYFVPKGMFENELYAGVPELLDATRRAGCVNVMATSKPEPFARQIAAHFGIDTRFELISGSSLDGSRTTKAEVIGHALRTLGITPEEAVMIGDRRHDIEGAAATGPVRQGAGAADPHAMHAGKCFSGPEPAIRKGYNPKRRSILLFFDKKGSSFGFICYLCFRAWPDG